MELFNVQFQKISIPFQGRFFHFNAPSLQNFHSRGVLWRPPAVWNFCFFFTLMENWQFTQLWSILFISFLLWRKFLLELFLQSMKNITKIRICKNLVLHSTTCKLSDNGCFIIYLGLRKFLKQRFFPGRIPKCSVWPSQSGITNFCICLTSLPLQ